MTNAPHPIRKAFAWVGVVLFALALGTGAWFFGASLARPPASVASPATNAAINVALYFLFAAHHSAMARTRAKQWVTTLVGEGSERSVYVWIASLLFIALCLLWRPLPGYVWQFDGVLGWVARTVQVLGLGVVATSALALDSGDLTGLGQLRGGHDESAPSLSPPLDVISTWGPYGWVRHPIYLGTLLLMVGAPEMTTGRLLFMVATTVYVVVAIPWEERTLVSTFGRQYVDYQRQIRWRLVPRVY